ncbi:hypothetical protein CEXT_88931 [Caerostris extrusa]|uniref:Uncharacterized protein n=1 Tax=Caerostris extrusa TaxID=172846 RepID=A0AAV4YDJ5_CAEEX|nr:hypothetical protein CEXT_88931 [Caerostris extrusa]
MAEHSACDQTHQWALKGILSALTCGSPVNPSLARMVKERKEALCCLFQLRPLLAATKHHFCANCDLFAISSISVSINKKNSTLDFPPKFLLRVFQRNDSAKRI